MARYGQELGGRRGGRGSAGYGLSAGRNRGFGSDVGGRNDLPNRPGRGGMGEFGAESSRGGFAGGGQARGGYGGDTSGRGYDRDFGSSGRSGRRYGGESGGGQRGGFSPREYDRDLGDRIRSGWNDLRRNVRQTFNRGGGYDRNW
jgi:hypothetical protein